MPDLFNAFNCTRSIYIRLSLYNLRRQPLKKIGKKKLFLVFPQLRKSLGNFSQKAKKFSSEGFGL